MIGQDRHPVLRLHDLHGGLLGQQFGGEAFVLGIEMLDQNEAHAAVRRHGIHKSLEGVKAAGRRADADHREAGRLARLGVLGQAPVRTLAQGRGATG